MEVFMGFVSPYPYNWAPKGWALCNGALLSIQQSQALFALIGTQFGGNGVNTFGLPDLRGRTIVGMGQQPGGTDYPVGAIGGKENVTLIANQVPTQALSGNVAVSTAAATTPTAALTNGQTAYLANAAAGSAANALKGLYTTTAPTQGAIANVPVTLGGGGSNPVPVMNPFLALNFCIAMVGIFPSRN